MAENEQHNPDLLSTGLAFRFLSFFPPQLHCVCGLVHAVDTALGEVGQPLLSLP